MSQTKQTALIWLTIIVLVMGVFFRFGNIDRKIHSPEETITYLRISGYSESEFLEHIIKGGVMTPQDIFKYQKINQEKDIIDSITEVIAHPRKAPLYYILARVWTQIFGTSLTALRSFSAIIGLLAFPAVYLLCRELFGLPLTRWIAIATISVSPFHVLFAGEGQPLTLLTTAILLSSAVLLRAMRVNTIFSWFLYSASVIVGFYTHWFFSCIAIAHMIYILFAERLRPNRIVLFYFGALAIALIAILPIVANVTVSSSIVFRDLGEVFTEFPNINTLESLLLDLTRPFFDLDRGWCSPIDNPQCQTILNYEQNLLYILAVPLLILIIYALYFLFANAPRRVGLLILVLIGSMAIDLILPDINRQVAEHSAVSRYSIPYLIGVELAIAYCLSDRIVATYGKFWQHKFWQLILIILLSLGVASSALSFQAYSWWNKENNYAIRPIAKIINETSEPLVLYSLPEDIYANQEKSLTQIVPLCNLLKPEVRLLFIIKPNLPKKIPDRFANILLYKPDPQLKEWLARQKNETIEAAYSSEIDRQVLLWKTVSNKQS